MSIQISFSLIVTKGYKKLKLFDLNPCNRYLFYHELVTSVLCKSSDNVFLIHCSLTRIRHLQHAGGKNATAN